MYYWWKFTTNIELWYREVSYGVSLGGSICNGLPEYNDNSNSEYIKLCMIQCNMNIKLILWYDKYCIILDDLYQLFDIK